MSPAFWNTFKQSFPPKSKFVPATDIPDLTGKVVAVTGGYTGVGWETCKQLLLHNADVYIFGRSATKAEAGIKLLKEATGKDVKGFVICDLADLNSIRAAAQDFEKKETILNVLFNNGGVMLLGGPNPDAPRTAQGYDMQVGTNTIGHYFLTTLLLPLLLRGYQQSGQPSRVVNTSSSGHELFCPDGGFDYEQIKPEHLEKEKYVTTTALYGISKMGNVMFSNRLQAKYGDKGIISTSLNPGNLYTELQRHATSFQQRLAKYLLYHPSFGALTQLWAGTTEEGASLGGKYLIPWAREGKCRWEGEDEKLGEELWTFMEKACEGF